MSAAGEKPLPETPDVLAPDGSEVRILVSTARGSMAHFRLQPGQVAQAIVHRSVDEVWYVTSGRGRIWRKSGDTESITELFPGLSLTIPVGTFFQFRCDGTEPLDIVGVTMPPWPGADEAIFVKGRW
ncbi:MAG: cupin domain-containing protein [Rhizobiales bacterium]|nr:cupin domain-containing protein [Hyphomicrobiales bacterium]